MYNWTVIHAYEKVGERLYPSVAVEGKNIHRCVLGLIKIIVDLIISRQKIDQIEKGRKNERVVE